MPHRDYPQCVLEVVDDQMPYRPEVTHAVIRFARRHPWRGTVEDREAKFEQLNRDLATACGIAVPALNCQCIDGSSSGSSHYIPTQHRIVLVGKLSVVTYLHEFAHALGMDERDACRWSINLFRRCFPEAVWALGPRLVTCSFVRLMSPRSFGGEEHHETLFLLICFRSSRQTRAFCQDVRTWFVGHFWWGFAQLLRQPKLTPHAAITKSASCRERAEEGRHQVSGAAPVELLSWLGQNGSLCGKPGPRSCKWRGANA